jgi:amidase
MTTGHDATTASRPRRPRADPGTATFITRLDTTGTGPRIAVKDIIDMAGVPTTAGSRAVERTAMPASRDAACLAGARAAGARLVGKANLHELAMLPLGTNPWFGTPVNPLDPDLIPGGSSSGSAVAVSTDEADVALGSDTGGSIRVPAACCGVAGLKTTYGRVPLDGVWPLAPSLDTIGPLATTIAGLVLGMQLIEPGFRPSPSPARTIGRLRTSAHPAIEAAVDDALHAAGFDIVTLDWDDFSTGTNCFTTIFFNEVWDADHELAELNPGEVGADITQTLAMTELFRPGLADARRQLAPWRHSLLALFDQVELIALPTVPVFPPRLDHLSEDSLVPAIIELTSHVSLFNAAGVPCTAQPVPVQGSHLPASLQLVGPHGGEELLLATAQQVQAATT